ncbi:MAG: alpha/beta hydrolase [Eubacteriales bacterium]|nr:alpha/beta hydrolase [Eubacteriales bacterium]
MLIKKYDIYEETGMKEPEGKGRAGILTAYLQDQIPTMCPRRTFPSVLILPGGSYEFTSKREAEPVALKFLAYGYNAFVLEYSCAPFKFPVSLKEVLASVKFIREKAEEFAADPDMVALLGFSAGGHLAGTAAFMSDAPEVGDIGSPSDFRLNALLLGYPVTVSHGEHHEQSFKSLTGGNEELKERLSLDRLVRAGLPPVFLWHTRNDASVPVIGSLILAEKLVEAGTDLTMHIYCRGKHGLSAGDDTCNAFWDLEDVSKGVDGWINEAIIFLKEHGFGITERAMAVRR